MLVLAGKADSATMLDLGGSAALFELSRVEILSVSVVPFREDVHYSETLPQGQTLSAALSVSLTFCVPAEETNMTGGKWLSGAAHKKIPAALTHPGVLHGYFKLIRVWKIRATWNWTYYG